MRTSSILYQPKIKALFILLLIGQGQQQNVSEKASHVSWCPYGLRPFYSENNSCKLGHVAVPLPYDCENNSQLLIGNITTSCYPVDNLVKPYRNISAFRNGIPVVIKENLLIEECDTSVKKKTINQRFPGDIWRLQFHRIQNIYAVLVSRTLGKEPFKHGIQVKVGRNVSSQVQQEFDCHFHNLHHDTEYYHTFYCLHPGYLASSHQMGIDAHSVHIYGNLSLEYSDRNLSEVFKIYPYPVKACGIPETYENQTVEPFSSFYLSGQTVAYRCLEENFILAEDGNARRKCLTNGIWTGSHPSCVRIQKFQPQAISSSYKDEYTRNLSQLKRRNHNVFSPLPIIANQTIIYQININGSIHCIQSIQLKLHIGAFDLLLKTEDEFISWRSNTTNSVWTPHRVQHYFPYNNKDQHKVTCASSINITRPARNDDTDAHSEVINHIVIFGYPLPEYRIKKGNATFKQPNQISSRSRSLMKWNDLQYCPVPSRIDHGFWNYPTENDYNHVQFNCSFGYELIGNESTIICINGSWNSQPPTCQITRCPRISHQPRNSIVLLNNHQLEVKNYINSINESSFFHHGVVYEYSCLEGFRLTGNARVECSNRYWSSPLPVCEPVLCDDPNYLMADCIEPVNMTYYSGIFALNSTPNQWGIGTHTFACPEGFQLQGDDVKNVNYFNLICQLNGEWERATLSRGQCCITKIESSALSAELTVIAVIGTVFLLISIASISYIAFKRREQEENREKNITTPADDIIEEVGIIPSGNQNEIGYINLTEASDFQMMDNDCAETSSTVDVEAVEP